MLTPMKAIRAKCLDCMCGQIYEIPKCPCTDCPLYPYRSGHNPNRKRAEKAVSTNDSDSEPENA